MFIHSAIARPAVRGRVLGIRRNRFPEGRDRPVVIEVVELGGGAGAQRGRFAVGARRLRTARASGRAAPAQSVRAAWTGPSVHLTPAGGVPVRDRLRRLCLTAYNCGRRLMSGQRSRTLDQPATHGSHTRRTTLPTTRSSGFWRKYVFSLDHKVIGIQYAVTGLLFLLFGFTLMMIMRCQLAYPGPADSAHRQLVRARTRRRAASCCPSSTTSSARCTARSWSSSASCRWPSAASATSSMPLQIGAPDMAFPKLNMMSYWVYFLGGVVMLASFFVPGGAAQSGWTSYPPLSVIAPAGQTGWLIGMIFLITSSLLGSINFIVTIVQLRAKGLSYMRLPFFVWAQLVTAFLLLLAFPPLEAAGVLQLMDRLAGTSFFLPSGLVVTNQVLTGHDRRCRGHDARRRRQPAALAASVLVPRASRGVRAHPARDGHRLRDHRQQHAEAAVGISRDGVLGGLPRVHVVHRLGAPHVHDRHGHGDERVLPDDDDDHFDPVGRHPDRAAVVALGGVDPLHDADAVRAGVPADVRHRRPDGAAAGPGARRHSPARHVLRHRSLPLRRRAGDHLRAVCGHLLLVPEGDRPEDERDCWARFISGARSSASTSSSCRCSFRASAA